MADRIWYVYGIVPAGLELRDAPAGIDDEPVLLDVRDGLGALVSALDADDYAPERIEQRVGDMGWMGPRAAAHDRVVTWASDHGPVIPFPMLSSIFRDRDAVRASLHEKHAQLAEALERVAPGREYTVRVYRLDDVLSGALPEVSPRIAELAAQLASASPGQRYLLQRKLEGERRAELRRIGSEVAQEVYAALAPLAMAAARDPVPAPAEGSAAGTAVLNASFLVRREAYEPFARELTMLGARHEPHGFRFEFTGPWPAYHFVRGPRSEERDGEPA